MGTSVKVRKSGVDGTLVNSVSYICGQGLPAPTGLQPWPCYVRALLSFEVLRILAAKGFQKDGLPKARKTLKQVLLQLKRAAIPAEVKESLSTIRCEVGAQQ